MTYLYAFLVCGVICAIGQILLDVAKFLPVHLTVLYVSLGSFLEMFGIYDKLIDFGHAGAQIPISSFGHSLTHAAILKTEELGYFGIFTGIFDLTASGIMGAIIFAFFVALVFRPRG